MTHPGADRGPATITAAVGAAVLLLIVILIGAVAGITGQQAAACQLQPAASTAAASIPARYLAVYVKAGAEYGIPWTILAGIGDGRVRPTAARTCRACTPARTPTARPGRCSSASAASSATPGAAPPSTPPAEHTGGYGIDGDGDGIVDVYDPGDAIPSAAAFLVAHGAPGNIPAALTAWDHLPGYLTHVLSWAARYAATGAPAVWPPPRPQPASSSTRPRCPPGPPGRSSPTPRPSSASPTCGEPPGRTRSTAPGWP